MAYNLATGDLIEVSFRGLIFGQKTVNIRHYVVGDMAGDMSALNNFNSWMDKMEEADGLIIKLLLTLPTNYKLLDVVFQRIRPTRNARHVEPVNLDGGVDDPPVAANQAAHIILTTDFATQRLDPVGQGMVGGWQTVALPPGHAADGVLTDAAKTLYGNFAAKLVLELTNALGNKIQPVIFHRSQTGTAAFTPLVTWDIAPQVRTQRTRNVGKGE